MNPDSDFRVLQLEQLYVQACDDRDRWRHRALRAEARLDAIADEARALQAAYDESLQ